MSGEDEVHAGLPRFAQPGSSRLLRFKNSPTGKKQCRVGAGENAATLFFVASSNGNRARRRTTRGEDDDDEEEEILSCHPTLNLGSTETARGQRSRPSRQVLPGQRTNGALPLSSPLLKHALVLPSDSRRPSVHPFIAGVSLRTRRERRGTERKSEKQISAEGGCRETRPSKTASYHNTSSLRRI